MRTRCSLASALVILLVLACVTSASARENRVALVIGNGSYEELGLLRNTTNDATDLASTLEDLGFEVDLLLNADLIQMEDAVIRFGWQLSESQNSIGIFYFAGHGVQSGGINYLIPVDSRIGSESFLKTRALAVQSLLDELKSTRNALNVVVLDACRDNPFSWYRSGQRGLSVASGQPPGSIIVYATSAGSVAHDGEGRNGIFTQELLREIRAPGVEIKDMFNRVGRAVRDETGGRQVPAVYNQFFDSVYLAGPSANEELHVEPALMPTMSLASGTIVEARTLLSAVPVLM